MSTMKLRANRPSMPIYFVLAACATLIGYAQTRAEDILIDGFTTGEQSVSFGSNAVAAPDALGGTRSLIVCCDSMGGTTSVDTTLGQLVQQHPATSDGPDEFQVLVDWSPTSVVDLTAAGTNDRFVLQVLELTGERTAASLLLSGPDGFIGASFFPEISEAGTFTIPFSDFSSSLSEIDFIRMQLQTRKAGEIVLGSLKVSNQVPEPNTLSLAMSIVPSIALLARRRRRRVH